MRGPAVAGAYYGQSDRILDADGFFDTGDIATIDTEGFLQITDRAKDLIKSGGEWISSVDIENAACGHPKVAVAGVIAATHPKWAERPLLVVQLKPGETATRDELLAFLSGRISRWQCPDDVVFVAAMPLGPTGKVDKKVLRARFAPTTGCQRRVETHAPDGVPILIALLAGILAGLAARWIGEPGLAFAAALKPLGQLTAQCAETGPGCPWSSA